MEGVPGGTGGGGSSAKAGAEKTHAVMPAASTAIRDLGNLIGGGGSLAAHGPDARAAHAPASLGGEPAASGCDGRLDHRSGRWYRLPPRLRSRRLRALRSCYHGDRGVVGVAFGRRAWCLAAHSGTTRDLDRCGSPGGVRRVDLRFDLVGEKCRE